MVGSLPNPGIDLTEPLPKSVWVDAVEGLVADSCVGAAAAVSLPWLPLEDVDETLPLGSGRSTEFDGDPTGEEAGDVDWHLFEMAIILVVASSWSFFFSSLKASTVVVSVPTTGVPAAA